MSDNIDPEEAALFGTDVQDSFSSSVSPQKNSIQKVSFNLPNAKVQSAKLSVEETKMVQDIVEDTENKAGGEYVSLMTRRTAVIVVVIVLVLIALVFIIVAAVITSQIGDTVGSGPSPPISGYIPSTPTLGVDGTGIPQGGKSVDLGGRRII